MSKDKDKVEETFGNGDTLLLDAKKDDGLA